jgi:hypothetical protein
MFELVSMAGTPERSIALETRLKRPIENAQSVGPDYQTWQTYRKHLNDHPGWERRKDPSGVYNCAGLVWAARRTAIYDDWEKILADDGYKQIVEKDVRVGDLVLYMDRQSKPRLLHVGVVLRMYQAVVGVARASSVEVPYVLSKWANGFGEVVHHFNDIPQTLTELKAKIEFWTDRHDQWTP